MQLHCVSSRMCLIFMLFNRFDMLRAARGVLAITIVWAALFLVKLSRMKYFIIAGEPSGDLHGSNLIRELFNKTRMPEYMLGRRIDAICRRYLLVHYRKLALMGFVQLSEIWRNLKNIVICKRQIIQYNPDVVIFIDYPGFNLRIAEFVKSRE